MNQKNFQSQIVPKRITFSNINPQTNAKIATSLIQPSSQNKNNFKNKPQHQEYQSRPQKSHIVIKNQNGGFDYDDSLSLQQFIPVRRATIFGESHHGSSSLKSSNILPQNLLDPVDKKYHLSKLSKQSQKKHDWYDTRNSIPQQRQEYSHPSLQASPQFISRKSLKKQTEQQQPFNSEFTKRQSETSNKVKVTNNNQYQYGNNLNIQQDFDEFYDFRENNNNNSNTAYMSLLNQNLLNFDSSRQENSLNFKRTSSKVFDNNRSNQKLPSISQKSNDQLASWILKDQQKKRQQELKKQRQQRQRQRQILRNVQQQKEQQKKRKQRIQKQIQNEKIRQEKENQYRKSRHLLTSSQPQVINYTDVNNNSLNMSGQTVNIGKNQYQQQTLSFRKKSPSNYNNYNYNNVSPSQQIIRQFVPVNLDSQVQTSFSIDNNSQLISPILKNASSIQSQTQLRQPQLKAKKVTLIDKLTSQKQQISMIPLTQQQSSNQNNLVQINPLQLQNLKKQMISRSQLENLNQKLQRISSQIKTELPHLHQTINQNQQSLSNLQKQLMFKKSLDNETYKKIMSKILQKQSLLYTKQQQLLQKQKEVSNYRQAAQKLKVQRQLQQEQLRRLQLQRQHQNRIQQLAKYNQKLCQALIQDDLSYQIDNQNGLNIYPHRRAKNPLIKEYDLQINQVQSNLKMLKKINEQRQFANNNPIDYDEFEAYNDRNRDRRDLPLHKTHILSGNQKQNCREDFYSNPFKYSDNIYPTRDRDYKQASYPKPQKVYLSNSKRQKHHGNERYIKSGIYQNQPVRKAISPFYTNLHIKNHKYK